MWIGKQWLLDETYTGKGISRSLVGEHLLQIGDFSKEVSMITDNFLYKVSV